MSMNPKPKTFSLIDMDVGLFLSYELTAEVLTTKLFRSITLNTIPLKGIKDFRQADSGDITKLNYVNWFSCLRKKRTLTPLYTLQADEKRPRIFMRLDDGSHYEMKQWLGEMNDG